MFEKKIIHRTELGPRKPKSFKDILNELHRLGEIVRLQFTHILSIKSFRSPFVNQSLIDYISIM